MQEAATPPSQTDASLGPAADPSALQAFTGAVTLPLFGQEQLGLQQSQYPVVYVPSIQPDSTTVRVSVVEVRTSVVVVRVLVIAVEAGCVTLGRVVVCSVVLVVVLSVAGTRVVSALVVEVVAVLRVVVLD